MRPLNATLVNAALLNATRGEFLWSDASHLTENLRHKVTKWNHAPAFRHAATTIMWPACAQAVAVERSLDVDCKDAIDREQVATAFYFIPAHQYDIVFRGWIISAGALPSSAIGAP
jgi:hypothetical protein